MLDHTRARARAQTRGVNEPQAYQMQARPFFSENKRCLLVSEYPTPMPDLLARVCVRCACDSPGSTLEHPAVVTAERGCNEKLKSCFSFLEMLSIYIIL